MNLTEEQKEAVHKIFAWCMTDEPTMCLTGIAGSGKSTVLKEVFSESNLEKITNKFKNEDDQDFSLALTATTNKAATVLAEIMQYQVKTLHSHLSITYDSFTNQYSSKSTADYLLAPKHVRVLVIDEASMLSWDMLMLLTGMQKWHLDKDATEGRRSQLKLLYVGDKYQLPAVKAKVPYPFVRGYPEVSLENTSRSNNPYITDLYLAARSAIAGAPEYVGSVEPKRIPVDRFNDLIKEAFLTNPEDSVILSYSNASVIKYNKMVQNIRGESTELVEGGVYVVNNSCIPSGMGRRLLRTEQRVYLESVQPANIKHTGMENIKTVQINGIQYIAGNSEDVRNSIKLLKLLAKDKESDFWEVTKLRYFDTYVADLRPGYAMTIHKSQGSTYKNVFIDVPDILKCRSTELRNRLFYVAISRAQENVYFLE